jgi:hypothetical protein
MRLAFTASAGIAFVGAITSLARGRAARCEPGEEEEAAGRGP